MGVLSSDNSASVLVEGGGGSAAVQLEGSTAAVKLQAGTTTAALANQNGAATLHSSLTSDLVLQVMPHQTIFRGDTQIGEGNGPSSLQVGSNNASASVTVESAAAFAEMKLTGKIGRAHV